MTDFTLGNDISKIQEEGDSSRSTNPVIFTTEKYSTSKKPINNNNNNNINIQQSISQDFNFSSVNNSVLEITNSSNNSPESKVKKPENELLETKNLTLNTTNYNMNTSSSLTVKKKDRRFGNTYPFLFYKGEPLIIIGPYWTYLFGISCFSTVVTCMFFYVFWEKITRESFLFGLISYLAHSFTYLFTALANPGIPNKNRKFSNKFATVGLKRFKVCATCNVVMNLDRKTSHCKSCDICVEGFDHHCMFLTKCIGKNNLRSFYLFIVTTWFLMGYMFYNIFTVK